MPPQIDATAFANCAKRRGHEVSNWGEDDRRIERNGRPLIGAPGPHGAKQPRHALSRLVPRPSKGVDFALLPPDDLCDDVRGGPEPEQPNFLSISRSDERTPSNQPGAQQRRPRDRIMTIRHGKREGGVRDDVGGKAAIAGVASELRCVA